MQLGIHFINFALPGGTPAIAQTLVDTAQAAEAAGCTTFTVMDHWFQMEGFGGAFDPMLEGYTTLGFLAAVTERVRLHLLVTGVTYRHPGLLAKIVSTLDVLSGGRAVLGLGAAWYEREHVALGVPYPPTGERLDRLGEALEVVAQMWSDDDGPYVGRYYRLAETLNVPQPLQRPRPPILIGGGGEKRTLALVARHADVWNLPFEPSGGFDDYRHKLEVLAAHCAEVGRDPATVEKSLMWVGAPPVGPAAVDAFLAAMKEAAALGVTDVHLMPPDADPVAFVTGLADDVLPALADL